MQRVSFRSHDKRLRVRALRPNKCPPPAEVTHTAISNSCAIPLNETDKEIHDRRYISGQNGVEWNDPLNHILSLESYIIMYMFESCNYIFHFFILNES